MSHHTHRNRKGQVNYSGWIGLAFLLVIGLLVGGFFLIRHLYRAHVLSPFESSRQEFLAARPTPNAFPTEGMCKGNVITIDTATGQFDHIFFDFPSELMAPDPASVQTVVFLNWTKVKIDEYQGGKPAYQHHCDVELVDRESKTLLRRQHFIGGEPPMSIDSRNSSGEGSRPGDAMIQFIKSCRRN